MATVLESGPRVSRAWRSTRNAHLHPSLHPRSDRFVFTLIMVRMSARRSLAGRTVFDSIFLVILASILARAINGSSDLLPTIGSGFVMVGFHRLLTWTAFYSHWFGDLVKGPERILMHDGNSCTRPCARIILPSMISKKICGSRYKLNGSTTSAGLCWSAAAASASLRAMNRRQEQRFCLLLLRQKRI
jgi:hypothetical protein